MKRILNMSKENRVSFFITNLLLIFFDSISFYLSNKGTHPELIKKRRILQIIFPSIHNLIFTKKIYFAIITKRM